MQEELVTDLLSVSVKYLWPLNPDPLPSSRATMTCPDPTRTQSQSGLNSSVTAWSPGEPPLSGQDRDMTVIITFVDLFDLHPRDTAAATAKEAVVFTGEITSHKPLYELHRWLCVSQWRNYNTLPPDNHWTQIFLLILPHSLFYFLFLFLFVFFWGGKLIRATCLRKRQNS